MSEKKPSGSEQDAADAIRSVEELLKPPEFEPNVRDTAPDWRVTMTNGRVADVEVTTRTDGDAMSFFEFS